LAKILVVEDDASLCDLIAVSLRREGLDVDCTDTAEDASERIGTNRYALVVLYLVLRASSGFYVVNTIRKMQPEKRPRVIVITGANSDAIKAIDRSIVKAILFKPLDLSTFAPLVNIEASRPSAGRPK